MMTGRKGPARLALEVIDLVDLRSAGRENQRRASTALGRFSFPDLPMPKLAREGLRAVCEG